MPAIRKGERILHIAPGERSLVRLFRQRGEYIAADIDPSRYRDLEAIELDLTEMAFDNTFDRIYASHVLEHILDDRLVMKKIFEHLSPSGIAMFLVPLRGATTEEGGPNLSANERLTRFGQHDHVRQYGMDIVARLSAAGVNVEVVDAGDLEPAVIEQHGFETHGYSGAPETDKIFLCRLR